MGIEVEITFCDRVVASVALWPGGVDVRLHGHAILLRALIVIDRYIRPDVTPARLWRVAVVARRAAPSQI